MASFDADIGLRVQVDKALKGIETVERRIAAIEDNAVELRVNGLQQANKAVNSLKKNLSTLGKIGIGALGVEGIGAAGKAVNDFADTLASLEQSSGIGSRVFNPIVEKLQELGASAVDATAPLAGLFDGINSLAAAGDGTGLAIGGATAALIAFAGPIDAARKKVQELVLGVNNLKTELDKFDDIEKAGRTNRLGEIERQLNAATKAARELDSSTEEYAATLKKVIQLEAERNAEVQKRTALTRSERITQGLDVVAPSIGDVTQKALPSAEQLAKRLKESNQEVQRLSKFYGDVNTKIDKGVQDANRFTQELKEAASKSQELPPIFKQVERSLKTLTGLTEEKTEAERKSNQLLKEAQQVAAQNAAIRKKDIQERREALAIQGRQINFERKLAEIQEKRLKQQERANNIQQNLAAGVGFPLLFGAGPGAILGGAIGSAGGFGSQILASSIGQQIDGLVAKIGEVGVAFSSLEPDINKVVESLGAGGSEFENYLRTLEDTGQAAQVAAEANRRLATLVGQEGADALQKYGDDLVALGRELNVFFTQLSAGFAQVFGDITERLTRFVQVQNSLRQARASDDPRLQQAAAGVEAASRTGLAFGGNEARIKAEEELLRLTQQVNDEEERRLELLSEQSSLTLDKIGLIEQEQALRALGGDLLDENVFRENERLALNRRINGEAEVYLELAQNKINKLDATLRLKELELQYEKDLTRLAEQRQSLVDSASRDAERAAREQERAAARAAREQERAARVAQRAAEQEARRIEKQEKLIQDTAQSIGREYNLLVAANDLERERLRIKYEYIDLVGRINQIENETLRATLAKDAEVLRAAQEKAALEQAQEPFKQLQEELVYLREKLTLGEREAEIQKQIRDLKEATSGSVSAEQIEQEVRARQRLNEELANQKALEEQIDALYKQLGQTVVSVFDDLINSTKDFNEILSSTLRQLSSFLLQAGFSALGNGAPKGSFLNTLFGSRAMGGPVSAGQPYIVGERGPELFVPSQSGGIVANGRGGGGAVVYNQTINISDSGTSSESDAAQLGRLVESSVVATIQREKRPGGLLG